MVPSSLYSEIGELVRAYRERINLTQEALARMVGLTRTSITNIERGRQQVLVHLLFLIADALGITPDALLPQKGKHTKASDELPDRFARQLRELSKEDRKRVKIFLKKPGERLD